MHANRIESAVDMEGRALEAPDLGMLVLETGAKRVGNAALADARLAADIDGEAFARIMDAAPFVEQGLHFGATPDERLSDFLAALRTGQAPYPVGMDGKRDALEALRAHILVIEDSAGKLAHLGTHRDGAGLCNALQTRGEIHRLADRRATVGGDHDDAGRDADAHLDP